MQEKIRSFILSELISDEPLELDTPLFSSRLLDSMDLTTLIVFMEKELSIKVKPLDIIYDNFDSVDKIANYVKGKQNGA